MFEPLKTSKSDLSPGTIYAIYGVDEQIYYGQVCVGKQFAFFSRRDRNVESIETVLATAIMCRFSVALPSVGRALRSGNWKKIGRGELREELKSDCYLVQWPQFTLDVTVWLGANEVKHTKVSDPAIQNFEIISAWDAISHVPERLVVDFDPVSAQNCSDSAWAVGGPVWRQRRVKEEFARRFKTPSHKLPEDWVPTGM